MNPNYATWTYEQLEKAREQLEELLRIGEDYPDVRTQLKAVADESAKRSFVLVGILSGRIVKEYGRWPTEEKGKEAAAGMGLPVGQDFVLSGQSFKTAVKRLF